MLLSPFLADEAAGEPEETAEVFNAAVKGCFELDSFFVDDND